MDVKGMERIPVDPRVVDRIQRSPHMMAEQGAGFMGDWGGPTTYRSLCELPQSQRMVYAAVLDGAASQEELEVVTGLAPEEVSRALSELQSIGKVSIEETSP